MQVKDLELSSYHIRNPESTFLPRGFGGNHLSGYRRDIVSHSFNQCFIASIYKSL